ncbi:MAG: hypothetical protein CMB56_004670 [Methanobacteriota archaeon]|nr:MAG: hypothetical protein CMB56_004670 [Euryarchaeota archaeon]|tara:strand:- start:1972 stop:2331 length:360 start_codon:yes stop_codon:yes gene_type:complete
MSEKEKIAKLIRLERKKETMLLDWSDGLQFELSYRTLLYWCPCAKCSPYRDDELTSSELETSIDNIKFEKPTVERVGSYALKFDFHGACNSGIYTFDRLYKLSNQQNPDDGKPYIHGAW